MKLNRGKRQVPIKAVIYGSEGIGKTTLASKLPDPLFIDVEGGTNQLDVLRVDEDFKNWKQVENVIKELDQELTRDKSLCKTVVIDTIDVAETILSEDIVKSAKNPNITTIGDFAYGNGQLKLRTGMDKFLKSLDELREKHGVNIVLLAHSHLRKQEKPDENGAFDRYELKLSNKVAERVKEWSDLLLFLNYKTNVIVNPNKMEKNKIVGGERVIYTTHHAAWDAKNRFGLPDELPLDINSIKGVFDQTQTVKETPKQAIDLPETLDDPDFIEIEPEIPDSLKRLMDKDGVTEEQIINALVSIGQIPEHNDSADRKTKIIDLSPEFIEANLVKPWDGFIKYLKQNK